jgi:hypothetical protein
MHGTLSSHLTDMPLTPDLVHGALELEPGPRGKQPHRLPAWARAQHADGQLAMTEAQPAGVRLVLRSHATVLEVDALRTTITYRGAPPRPDGVYDLLVDGVLAGQASIDGGDVLTLDIGATTPEHLPGPVGTVRFEGLPARDKTVEIWLPHNELTKLVGLRSDAPVHAVVESRRRWLHHGSSISQGSNATSPTATWTARAAAAAGVSLVNLGFGGGALLDPFTARVMRDTPADVISLELGINLVNTDLMRLRALGPAVHGFLDTIRDGHPDAPLLVISPVLCPMHEDTPGPTVPDLSRLSEGRMLFRAGGDPQETAAGKLTLNVVRTELARIVGQRQTADPHLHLLDGRTLYGDDDAATLPLPDGLHPDTQTHALIADRFVDIVFTPGGPMS